MHVLIYTMAMIAASSCAAFKNYIHLMPNESCPLPEYSQDNVQEFYKKVVEAVSYYLDRVVQAKDSLLVPVTLPGSMHVIMFINHAVSYYMAKYICAHAEGQLPWYEEPFHSILQTSVKRESSLQKHWMKPGFEMWLGLQTGLRTHEWYHTCATSNGYITYKKWIKVLPWHTLTLKKHDASAAFLQLINVSGSQLEYNLIGSSDAYYAGKKAFACVATLKPAGTSTTPDPKDTTDTGKTTKTFIQTRDITGTKVDKAEDKPQDTSEQGSNVSLIVAIVVSAAVLLLIITIILAVVKRRQTNATTLSKTRKQSHDPESPDPDVVRSLDEISTPVGSEMAEKPNPVDKSFVRGIPIVLPVGGKNKCLKRKGCPCDICKARARLDEMAASTSGCTTTSSSVADTDTTLTL